MVPGVENTAVTRGSDLKRIRTERSSTNYLELSQRFERRWAELCSSYLSVTVEGSIWRYSRAHHPADPVQGWKLHLSATIMNAHKVLERVAELLMKSGTQFKGPSLL